MNIKKCLVCGRKNLIKYLDLGKQSLANNLSKKIKYAKNTISIRKFLK